MPGNAGRSRLAYLSVWLPTEIVLAFGEIVTIGPIGLFNAGCRLPTVALHAQLGISCLLIVVVPRLGEFELWEG